MSIEQIRQQLQTHGIKPNKALGQNFLTDDAAIARIADEACALHLPVLEIGPGLGALTAALIQGAPRVTAVELDSSMVGALSRIFASQEKIEVVHGDFLKFDLEGYAQESGAFCAAGNLPYYLTTPICIKLLTGTQLPMRMVLMVQKEAAARFTAKIGTKLYGPLSVLTQLYYDCAALMTLSPSCYYPQPEVDSTVMVLSRKIGTLVSPALPKLLEIAFSMRRKTLLNNLRMTGLKRGEAFTLLSTSGIPEHLRAEQVSPVLFAALSACIDR